MTVRFNDGSLVVEWTLKNGFSREENLDIKGMFLAYNDIFSTTGQVSGQLFFLRVVL